MSNYSLKMSKIICHMSKIFTLMSKSNDLIVKNLISLPQISMLIINEKA